MTIYTTTYYLLSRTLMDWFRHLLPFLFILLILACQPLKNDSITRHSQKDHNANIEEAQKAFELKQFEAVKQILFNHSSDQTLPNYTAIILADSQRLTGENQAAINTYDEVLTKDETNILAMEGKAIALMNIGQLEEAKLLLQNSFAVDASRWRSLNALATIFMLEEQPENAMEYFDMALQIAPNNIQILNNIGMSYLLLGQYDIALETLRDAHSNASSSSITKKLAFNLALAYGFNQEFDAAKKILKPYLDSAEIDNNLGYYAKLTNNPDIAKTYFSQALSKQSVFYEKAWNNKP